MKNQRGAAIVFVMIALGLLAAVAATVTTMSTRSVRSAYGQGDFEVALYAAEAGAWTKVAEIVKDGNDADIITPQSLSTSDATYTVDVTALGADEYEVTATGTSPAGRVRYMTIRFRKTASVHTQAIFAYSSIEMNQGRTSTYDSLTGLETDLGLGHVGVADGGSVIFDGSSTLDADVITGDPTANVVLGTGATVSGSSGAGGNFASAVTNSFSNVPTPIVPPFPPGSSAVPVSTFTALAGGAYGDVDVASGQTLRLQSGGVYVFNKLKLDENSRLELPTGATNVKIYVVEQMEIIKGSIINPSSQPENLEFNVVGGTVDHKDLGTTGYYVLNAPFSDVTIQNSQVYGSIIGDTVKLDGDISAGTPAWVHYDQNLAATGGGGNGIQVLSTKRI